MAGTLPHAPLGRSGIEVSRVALGSWRTFERIPPEAGVAVMTAAREAGIDFLDDARYNDETGRAPIPTGYSEVVFGELFRAAGWRRDEVVVSNKLWWEFWPEQPAAAELDASLGRMGLDHLDLAYAERPPDGLSVDEVVASVGALIAAGKLRAWGLLNWPAPLLAEAGRSAAAQGVPLPAAVQLPYNLVRRSPVEDAEVADALAVSGASVVASAVLAGGALSGKYGAAAAAGADAAAAAGQGTSAAAAAGADASAAAGQGAGAAAAAGADAAATRGAGRLASQRDDPALAAAFAAGEDLRALAGDLDTTPAALSIAFALAHPSVATVLFGATSPAQIAENVAALDLLERLDGDGLARLRAIGR
jgi:aryl-alcohol dehydrogenase-like predicted oxidoreductase